MNQEEFIELTRKLNDVSRKLASTAQLKDCFYPDHTSCVAPIKSAHSLQRQGALQRLEATVKGNSFLYSFVDREPSTLGDFLDFKPIGRKSASTFYGFCEYHDTVLFSPIENIPNCTDINSDFHCFLHSYRSFAHSYHRKYEELKLFESTDPSVVKLLEEIYGKKNIPYRKLGVQMAVNDMIAPKKKLDDFLLKKQYDGLDYYVVEYQYTAPIACAALTSPPYSFSGKKINLSLDPNFEYSNIITTVLPFANRTVIILAAFYDEPYGSLYLDELDKLKYPLLEQKALSFHLLTNAENCYVSPKYYDSKSIAWKKSFSEFLNLVSSHEHADMKFDKTFHYNLFGLDSAI